MRFAIRLSLAGLFCLAIALGAVTWMTGPDMWRKIFAGSDQTPTASVASPEPGREDASDSEANNILKLLPDPNAPSGSPRDVFLAKYEFDSGVYRTAADFTGPISDTGSLESLRDAIKGRTARGLTYWKARSDSLVLDTPATTEQAVAAIRTWRAIAFLEMYEGRFAEAKSWLERGLPLTATPGVPKLDRAYLRALLGICALRRGEIENCLECLGPSSCIFPIDRQAVHLKQTGSREAIDHFTAYLDEWPGDIRIRWLLNIAYMTLGEYPEKVPSAYVFPSERFRSKTAVARFDNVAPRVGLGVRGPNLAGGSIFDDFNGDGLADLFVTSVAVDQGAALFLNGGDGQFNDHSESAGLDPQFYALNLTRADYDNDGDLDVLLLRGGWEKPARLALLRNDGTGKFDDVTTASGMDEPIASESAAWGDYDNDGLLDVFVCGEYAGGPDDDPGAKPDPRNLCRLYHNLGNGKFVNVAARAGVLNERYAKGAVWGDYDDDGRPDLFVSNMGQYSGRLYHNEGNDTFRDVASEVGIVDNAPARHPSRASPVCSGISITTAGSISSSMTGGPTRGRSWRAIWAYPSRSPARRGFIATWGPPVSRMSVMTSASTGPSQPCR